jgi:GTPase SAR1 family protein
LCFSDRVGFSSVQEKGPADIVIAIVGNKADLFAQRQVRVWHELILEWFVSDPKTCPQVDAKKARDFAASINALFFETSAKEDTNVQSLFIEVST